MSKNDLILDCSPRSGGNSDVLTAWLTESLPQAQVTVLRNFRYSACIGCEQCANTGKCIRQDAATLILEEICRCDRLFIVAPVYFYGFDAHTKALIDRAQYLWSSGRKAPRIPVYLLACGGQNQKDNFDGMLLTLRSFALTFGGYYVDGLYFPNTDARRAVETEYNRRLFAEKVSQWGK